MGSTAASIETLMILLLAASAVGLVVRFIKVPYSIALVLVGLLLGASNFLNDVRMEPDIILFVFLPALLFEASWNLDAKELKEHWWPVFLLAGPGVVISMFVTGLIVSQLGHFDFKLSLLFGAMVAATDPISVLAIIRRLGCDKRLSLLMEAESLFNDGTAVVLFKLILALVLTSASSTLVSEPSTNSFNVIFHIGQFIWAVVGGATVGGAIGYLGSRATRYFDDHLLEITLTTIVAYGSYLLAEHIHVSPVISVLLAGIVVGNYGSRTHMSAATRLAVDSFWQYAAFLVNSLVFLLIGMQINIALLSKYGVLISIGIVAVLVARFVLIYVLGAFLSTKDTPVPMSWKHLLFWGGLRGSLSMAMVLSLPNNFGAGREELTVLTFAVVLFTLLVPGLTCEPLVKFLKLVVGDKGEANYERLRSQLTAEQEALSTLNSLNAEGSLTTAVYESLRSEIAQTCAQLNAQIEALHLNDTSKEAVLAVATRKQLLEVRKHSLLNLVKHHGAARGEIDLLVAEIDSKISEFKD